MEFQATCGIVVVVDDDDDNWTLLYDCWGDLIILHVRIT
jgi:hypothetical protein